MSNSKLIFIELNELNFSYVKKYLKENKLSNFQKIFDGKYYETTSENDYELLEPWIQWVSIHTGKKANEHKIFRLGDTADKNVIQIFEAVEQGGYSVGALMPMNTRNNLKSPKYFIPDAWTKTKTDGSFWSNFVYNTLSRLINRNAEKNFSYKDLFNFFICFIKFAKIKNYYLYLNLFFKGLSQKYNFAIILDLFLHDIHMSFIKKHNVDFSTIFLNASAHIQHHYFFNSKVDNNNLQNPEWHIEKKLDPLLEVIKVYDKIIGDYNKIQNYKIIITTGLSQKKYDRKKFYYRLKNHEKFLKKIGISFKSVYPRMTRDFLVNFENQNDLNSAETIFKSIETTDGKKIFTEVEKRDYSLFITLGYPEEIDKEFKIKIRDEFFDFYKDISFVGIKNGMHSPKGYLYLSDGVESGFIENNLNITNIYKILSNFFSLNTDLKKYE